MKSNKENTPIFSILFFIACVVIAFGDKVISGTNFFIAQVIAYIVIIYTIYAGEIFSQKTRVFFIIGSTLMLIGEIGSFISASIN